MKKVRNIYIKCYIFYGKIVQYNMYVFSQFYITNYVSVLALCIKLKLKLLKSKTKTIKITNKPHQSSYHGFQEGLHNYGADFFSIGSLRLLLRYTVHTTLPAYLHAEERKS